MRSKLHPDAEKFREYLSYDKSESTARNYSQNVNKFLIWVDKPLQEITPSDIADWYQSLEKAGYATRTIWRYGHALRSFWDLMGMQEMKRRTPIVEVQAHEPQWIDKETTFKLIASVPALCVSYDLALRVGELKFLVKSKYNPNTGDIEARRLKHKGQRNTYLLPLSPWCQEVLNEYLEHINGDRMFPQKTETLQKLFNAQASTLDLEGYTFHSLRHSRITHLALQELEEKGVVNELSLSKFAGHLRVETTRMYVHLATRHLAFRS